MNNIQNYDSFNVNANYGKVNKSPNFKAMTYANGGKEALEKMGKNVEEFVTNPKVNYFTGIKGIDDNLIVFVCDPLYVLVLLDKRADIHADRLTRSEFLRQRKLLLCQSKRGIAGKDRVRVALFQETIGNALPGSNQIISGKVFLHLFIIII